MSTLDNVVGFVGFLVFFAHATVSFREKPWMPRWLGQGLLQSHPTVHARVTVANLYYAVLMVWVISRLDQPGGMLVAALVFGAVYMVFNTYVRGGALVRSLRH